MVFCNPNGDHYTVVDEKGHNPYFNRWFSAIRFPMLQVLAIDGHNPYFNRWFSAISLICKFIIGLGVSQSLF